MNSTSFKAACATGQDWQTIAADCLADLGGEPAGASLGLLYVTGSLAPYLSNLLDRLRAGTGIQDWVGTVGSGICYTAREIYDEPAAAVMPDDTLQEDFSLADLRKRFDAVFVGAFAHAQEQNAITRR